MGKKGKKKVAEPEVEIDPDLKELTIPNVKDRIDALQYRLSKAAKDRNYMQLEKARCFLGCCDMPRKDMVNRQEPQFGRQNHINMAFTEQLPF